MLKSSRTGKAEPPHDIYYDLSEKPKVCDFWGTPMKTADEFKVENVSQTGVWVECFEKILRHATSLRSKF